jgi:hypothetical protein
MTAKNKPSLIRIIMELITIVPNLITLATNVTSLINLKSRLVGKNIFKIVLLSVVFSLLLTTSWLCLLGMLLVYFVSLPINPLVSLAIVFLINTLVLIIIGVILAKEKKNLFFSEARSQGVSLSRKEETD